MNTPHHDHIDTAFLQLSFAMKLWHFPDEHPIAKETFDIELIIRDPGSRICLSRNEVQTSQDLKLVAENNNSICSGGAAITLWEGQFTSTRVIVSEKLNLNNKRKDNLAPFR